MTGDNPTTTASLADMITYFSDSNFIPSYSEAIRIIHEQGWHAQDEPAALAVVALHVLQQPGTRTGFLHRLAARDSETVAKLRAVWMEVGE